MSQTSADSCNFCGATDRALNKHGQCYFAQECIERQSLGLGCGNKECRFSRMHVITCPKYGAKVGVKE